MTCALTIQMDNDAFDENSRTELARILRNVATKLEHEGEVEEGGWSLRDINGNTVGEFSFIDD